MMVPKRIRASYGDALTDDILNMLVGFSYALKERDGYVDIITTRRAERETRAIIKAYKEGKYNAKSR